MRGGRGSFEGRVEVYYQGAWGTVCGDDWDLDDAHVVCHTLGYPRASAYYTNATFGEGTGEIILDNVNCTGSESNIAFCQHNGYLSHNCEHRQDAGVTCEGFGNCIFSLNSRGGGGVIITLNETIHFIYLIHRLSFTDWSKTVSHDKEHFDLSMRQRV